MNNRCSRCGNELTVNTKFCPECGMPDKAPVPESSVKAGYDVFLSYSHKDRDEFGMEYILRIKEEIEEALAGIVANPRVFLDAEALHLGDLWHSKIMESLRQCKVFVCLISEQYLESEYLSVTETRITKRIVLRSLDTNR